MKILVCLILLLTLNIKSAEFTFEAYGVNDMKNSVVTKNKEHTYFSFINEGVIITNIDRVGESHCAGGLNISKEVKLIKIKLMFIIYTFLFMK